VLAKNSFLLEANINIHIYSSIYIYIYLRAELNSLDQLQSYQEYKTITKINRWTKTQRKKDIRKTLNQLRLFKFKRKFLKISTDSEAAEAHSAEGQ
jgi:methionine aminopeptidase